METLKWTSIGKPGAVTPPPRSGCQLALHADAGVLFLYGGAAAAPRYALQQSHRGAPVFLIPPLSPRAGYRKEPGEDGVETGVVLSDCWALELKGYTWERVKKAGVAPGPRAGAPNRRAGPEP